MKKTILVFAALSLIVVNVKIGEAQTSLIPVCEIVGNTVNVTPSCGSPIGPNGGITGSADPSIPCPKIISIDPATAPVGTTVTVHGCGFSSSDNSVIINSLGNASVREFTDLSSTEGTTLTFTVPSVLKYYIPKDIVSAGALVDYQIRELTAGNYYGVTVATPEKKTNQVWLLVSAPTSGTPIGTLPVVTTEPATSITSSRALLNAKIASNGGSDVIGVGFDYGKTMNYGAGSKSSGVFETGLNITLPTAPLSPLSCGTTYHFRAIATNAAGTVYGNDMTFSTPSCNTKSPDNTTQMSSLKTPLSISKSLHFGQTDIEIKTLQQYLVTNGYLLASPTGYYGILTQSAVRKLQADLGIDSDGSNVGIRTRTQLSSIK